jgi:hypothetical protein
LVVDAEPSSNALANTNFIGVFGHNECRSGCAEECVVRRSRFGETVRRKNWLTGGMERCLGGNDRCNLGRISVFVDAADGGRCDSREGRVRRCPRRSLAVVAIGSSYIRDASTYGE